ncbi:MAG: TadE/TadG family type IV pilus assembly protein [Pseudomonadota bacterium]
MLNPHRHHARGAAMVEFHIVALFALLPLLLGTLQTGLLLVANHHVDYATFSAARRGAVSHGDPDAIRAEFTRAMVPLFVSANPVSSDNVVPRVIDAYARAAVDVGLHAHFTTLAPDPVAQREFAIEREGEWVIPNDALNYRSSGVADANLLKIEVVYCHPLLVPFARELLIGALRTFDHDPWHHACYATGRVPLRSVGITPMQSDFRVRGG